MWASFLVKSIKPPLGAELGEDMVDKHQRAVEHGYFGGGAFFSFGVAPKVVLLSMRVKKHGRRNLGVAIDPGVSAYQVQDGGEACPVLLAYVAGHGPILSRWVSGVKPLRVFGGVGRDGYFGDTGLHQRGEHGVTVMGACTDADFGIVVTFVSEGDHRQGGAG